MAPLSQPTHVVQYRGQPWLPLPKGLRIRPHHLRLRDPLGVQMWKTPPHLGPTHIYALRWSDGREWDSQYGWRKVNGEEQGSREEPLA